VYKTSNRKKGQGSLWTVEEEEDEEEGGGGQEEEEEEEEEPIKSCFTTWSSFIYP
jgi:hypothetical protein